VRTWIIIFLLFPFTIDAQIITTWAGQGLGGGTDGLGDGLHQDSAIFYDPGSPFFDKMGNCYIADVLGYRIRKIDTFGVITSIAGTGSAGYNGDGGLADTSKLNEPGAAITDSIGNIYIADAINHRVRKIDHISGVISTIAGTGIQGYSGDNGLSINAKLISPTQVCFDNNGNLLILDNTTVRKINKSGIITTIAGNGNSTYISTVNGGLADTSAIGATSGICLDNHGNMFISDFHNVKIYEVNNFGIIKTIAGTGMGYLYNGDNIPALSAQISPSNVKINPKDGYLYFNDNSPNNRIRMIDSAGVIHTVAGNGSNTYSGDNGLATSAGIPNPGGIGFDNCGNLYISQVGSPARIRKVTFDTSCHIHAAQTGGDTTKTGIQNINANNIEIYPNPATDVLHIEVLQSIQYRLMNIVGAVVLQGVLKVGSNSLDVTQLTSGMYVIELISKEGRIIRKVLKQ